MQFKKTKKLSEKVKLDIATMSYFYPKSSTKPRIYPHDKQKMADLSSHGIQPKRRTKGFEALIVGKMYRDLQITSYRDDVMAGYFTKIELIEAMPKRFQPWLEAKLKNVPYDINGDTSRMIIEMYRGDTR